MRHQLTPAAERALQAAAGWASRTDSVGLEPPEILLGLLEESECRAARMLAARGVGMEEVVARWPGLGRLAGGSSARTPGSSPALLAMLRAAEDRLWDYPQPLALATEHLLLGLAAGENEVAQWLRSRGMFADELEAEIHQLAGHERGPLSIPEDEPPVDAPEPPSATPATIANQRAAETVGVVRILDAAANRAAEGLRVVEDFVRFALDDRHLTGQLKSMRHELADVLSDVAPAVRLAARESQADIGADIKTLSEFDRPDVESVLIASFQRVQQAMRSLEEFSKLATPAAAARLEKLRYAAYTLERAVQITRQSAERLASARLYVLVDGLQDLASFCTLAEELVAAGVHALQLRDKKLDDRSLLERARALREITRGRETLFIMNDRPDLAVLADADGVHVGQEELGVKDVRTIVGLRRLIGVSTHSIEQARRAVLEGANYLGVGPTFPSGTKAFEQFPGLEFVRQVSAEIRLPTFAIGGISLENLSQVIAAGAQRVAVAGAVCKAQRPSEAVRAFLKALTGL